jgi:hypothetical protein
VTYQFLENSFMHPYMTGGVRVGVLREHRVREQATYRVGVGIGVGTGFLMALIAFANWAS